MSAFDYNTFEEKHLMFQYSDTKTITTESEFKSFFEEDLARNSNFGKLSIFRGVGEAKWKIISSCQRAFLSGKVPGENQELFIEKEIRHIEEVNDRLLPKYYHELGVPVTDFIYLSFLQHYGAATTLIDFSKNHKAALWMATNNIQYPIISENDIDNYFSIYWIDKEDYTKIPSILEKYQENYLRQAIEITDSRYTDSSRNRYNLSSDLNNIIEDKKLVLNQALKFIKWDNGLEDSCLAKTKLGIIHTNNSSHHDRRHSLEQITDEMQKAARTLSKNMSHSAFKAFKNIASYLFNETVRIANLNLVAQEGCFIHYLPESYKTPLEEYNTMKGIIHCVDIHKSLAPFILNTLNQDGVNQKTMYPDTRDMAQYAFQNAQAHKL